MEEIVNDRNEENNNSPNLSTVNTLLEANGFIAKINGEIINPEEVSILKGDLMTKEITQLVQYLCNAYPFEAIDYCLKRCFYKSFSKTSLLDKTIKYLLDKYEKNEMSEKLIIDLFYSYKENILLPKISNINQFNSSEDKEDKHMTKIVFYDQSKEDIQFKNIQNEIFIEIDSNLVNEKTINLKESEKVEIFLCEKHHLFKRFCKSSNFIYVYDFYTYEKIEKNRKNKEKKKKNGEKKEDNYDAIFVCEQKGCSGKYKYNLNSNKFSEIFPHDDIGHDENENSPSYYQENIKLLLEKPYITDIQMIIYDS